MKKLFIIILFLAGSCFGPYAAGQTPANVTPPANPATVPANAAPQVNPVTVPVNAAPQFNPAVAPANTTVATAKAISSVDCFPVESGSKRRIVGWVLIVGIICLFMLVVYKTGLIRDSIADPVAFMQAANAMPKYAGVTNINKIPKPFSLSRSQLGCWTVIISCSYIYLQMCKFFCMTDMGVNSTMLALLGISAITAAAGNVIDNNSSTAQQGLQVPSEGFFKDILSDQNGINIHRFQNVIWTIIAIVLYIGKIPHVLCGELPVLDPTLIALTGISSLTYLGLKVNENTTPLLTAPGPAVVPPVAPVPAVAPPVAPAPAVMPPVAPVPPVVPPVAPPGQNPH